MKPCQYSKEELSDFDYLLRLVKQMQLRDKTLVAHNGSYQPRRINFKRIKESERFHSESDRFLERLLLDAVHRGRLRVTKCGNGKQSECYYLPTTEIPQVPNAQDLDSHRSPF